jgi:uncharacterized protein YihD (DUF1040 family)
MKTLKTLQEIIDDLQNTWAEDPDVSINEFHWRWMMVEQARQQITTCLELLMDLIDLEDQEEDDHDQRVDD